MNLGQLKAMIVRVVGDTVAETDGIPDSPLAGSNYPSGLLVDSVHAALGAILPWIWKGAILDLVPVLPATTATSFAIPADFVRVEGVVVNGSTLHKKVLNPSIYDLPPRDWSLFPAGFLTLNTSVDATSGAKMYYAASWAKPEDDEDVLECPEYAITGIIYYAASYCLLPKSTETGGIRQYGTKVDSGNPEDNPILTVSGHFLKRFQVEMNNFSGDQRGSY